MRNSRVMRAALAAAVGALGLMVAACAMPPIDRYLLHDLSTTPVRLEGPGGPLSRAQSETILAKVRARSPDGGLFDRHVAVEEAIAGSPLNVGNRVTLLEDGQQAYPAMLAAIRSARHHVHFETYIYEEDDVGRQFAEALVERAKAGVAVRLIYDSHGSKETPRRFFDELRAQGVQVLEFHPLTPEGVLKKGIDLNKRNHRKLMIADGRIAILGGINISGVYGSESRASRKVEKPADERPWRDIQVQVEGPAVADFQRLFVETWQREAKQKLEDRGLFPKVPSAGNTIVRALEGSPDQKLNPLYVTFVSAISNAEREVFVTMAYFVPDRRLLDEIKEAARRGVDVRLILPSQTDSWIVLAAGRSFYADMLAAGVKIYERKNRVLHSKTAVIDGVWSTIGSTNLDWRSLLHNYELNAVILDPDFGERMRRLFERDLAQSEQITVESWGRRPLAERLKEAAARSWAIFL